MSRRTNLALALALSLSGASACDEVPEAAFGDGEVALRPGGYSGGGVLLNTSATGEWAVDQIDLNFGNDLDGLILKAVTIKGKDKDNLVKLDKVWVKNGEILGAAQGTMYSGVDFLTSTWYLHTPSAVFLKDRQMTISAITVDPTWGNYKYTFVYPNDPAGYGIHFYGPSGGGGKEKDQEKTSTLAVCAPDPVTGSIEAVIYSDMYVNMTSGDMKDFPGAMSLACLSGGVGKAGGIYGFFPYLYGVEVLQAATRMTRDDFCGDGTSYTKPGNAFYEEDVFGLHNWGAGAGNTTEAIWTAKGAACIDTPRDPAFTYADVDCGGWTPMYCKDMTVGDIGPEALMHTRVP